jgi:hypothetical protein
VVIRLLLWQVWLSVQSSRDGLAMPEDEFRAEQLALTAVSDYCRRPLTLALSPRSGERGTGAATSIELRSAG